MTAYGKMPLTDEEQAKVNESNVYNDKYIGNFLSLIGTTYFTQLDIENKVLAGANRIYAERYLSYGVFSYEPCVTVSAFSKDIEKKGSFSVDILGKFTEPTRISLVSSNVPFDETEAMLRYCVLPIDVKAPFHS